ncbi:MAG: phosphoglycerate dehydrogenase [Chloroflexi bacterium]|nr:phosphoglycerate dehydrogenase [Chloroflexota bacterium]MCY4246141.1 phosphoglycerate dehydrogenase [Chloroflexota bacterium]
MTTKRVVIATDLTADSLDLLKAADGIDAVIVPPKTAQVREALAEASAIITRSDFRLDAPLLGHAPKLKLIARMSAGLTGVDIDAATARGILVMNAPGGSAIAAAEHTVTLMLALARNLPAVHESLREGWWLFDRSQQIGRQLHGKTCGIVGLGRVGGRVAQLCLALGMRALACDPYIHEEQIRDARIQLVGLDELLRESDYISLHVPATRETQNLLTAESLTRIKPGACFINTAHGGIVSEALLADALKEGRLGGVALDVWDEEPPFNSPLIGMDNVIHTPHIGDNTAEARQDLSLQIARQVIDALADRDYRNVVNMPLLPGLSYDEIRPYMQLAEGIGTLQHALARSPIRRIAIEIIGEDMNGLIKAMTVGILKGLLSPFLGDQVSYVNAPLLAAERGWQITQAKGIQISEYRNVITCQITMDDSEEISIAGALFDQQPMIVQINDYRVNFEPRGHLLIMGSYDKPGVIGRVGTLMAQRDVNIASWHTGRAEPGGNTLTALSFDEDLPDDVMETLRAQDFIRHVHQLRI